jgi:TonB family protein
VVPSPSLAIVREGRREVAAPASQAVPSHVPEATEDVATSVHSNPGAAAPAQRSAAPPGVGTSMGMEHEPTGRTGGIVGQGAPVSGTASGIGSVPGTGSGSGRPGVGGAGAALVGRGVGPGDGGSEYGPYLAQWRRRIHENVRYPLAARRRGLTGTVQLDIVIQPSGAVASVQVAESSAHGLLDEAAMEAVRALPPLPFPAHLAPRALRARLPVVFDLQ